MGAKFKRIIAMPAILVGVMVLVFAIELVLPGNFHSLGIRPRSLSGLTGIICSPFLHGSLAHLFANAVPLLIMGSFVSALSPRKFTSRTTLLVLMSGGLTWLISFSGVVIGASGLVFAFWSYLILNGVLKKRLKDLLIGLVTFLIYGALIYSFFRFQVGVSWAGHLSGAIAGVILAIIERRR